MTAPQPFDVHSPYASLMERLMLPRAATPLHEIMPTVAEGLEMMKSNPGLSMVATESGYLHRDGRLVLPAWSRSEQGSTP